MRKSTSGEIFKRGRDAFCAHNKSVPTPFLNTPGGVRANSRQRSALVRLCDRRRRLPSLCPTRTGPGANPRREDLSQPGQPAGAVSELRRARHRDAPGRRGRGLHHALRGPKGVLREQDHPRTRPRHRHGAVSREREETEREVRRDLSDLLRCRHARSASGPRPHRPARQRRVRELAAPGLSHGSRLPAVQALDRQGDRVNHPSRCRQPRFHAVPDDVGDHSGGREAGVDSKLLLLRSVHPRLPGDRQGRRATGAEHHPEARRVDSRESQRGVGEVEDRRDHQLRRGGGT